jgi:hypothetical protein
MIQFIKTSSACRSYQLYRLGGTFRPSWTVEQTLGASPESSSSDEGDDAPAYLFELDGPLPPQDGSFMDGFHVNFADWDEFTHGFFEFVKDRFMIFKKRSKGSFRS